MTRTMGRPAAASALVILLGLLLVAGVLLVASPARACSCVEMDPAARLPDADGAFIGSYVDRSEVGNQRVAFTFEIERVVKGDFGPTAIVRTNETGGPCGLEFYGDRRTGLLLRQAEDGVWESDLCSMVEPSELLVVGGDHPPDPEVAPVSAGLATSTNTMLVLLVGSAVIVAAALALVRWFGRRAPARREEPA